MIVELVNKTFVGTAAYRLSVDDIIFPSIVRSGFDLVSILVWRAGRDIIALD